MMYLELLHQPSWLVENLEPTVLLVLVAQVKAQDQKIYLKTIQILL